MAPHLQWPDLLEEEAYLVQLVSESPLESGTLEQTTGTLDALRVDLQSCATEVAELERDIQEHNPKRNSSSSRLFHRITGSISSGHSHLDKGHDAQNEQLAEATTRKGTLQTEINNLEIRAQVLQRRIRHHEELKHRLRALYDHVFNGSIPTSPEEEEAEKELRKAQHTLHQSQQTVERHRTLTTLLGYCDFVLSNAGPHLSAAVSSGSDGIDPKIYQAEVSAAKTCVVQASIVVDQAKRLDPSLFEQGKGGEFFGTNWLSNIFRTQSSVNSDSHQSIPSQQALQSHHSALVSLLNLARRRYQEHEANLRRVANRHAEVYGRKQMLRRRILLKYADAEESRLQNNAEENTGGFIRTRDITAGLDKLIVAVSPRPGTSQNKTGEEKGRQSSDGTDRDRPLGRLLDPAFALTQSPDSIHGQSPARGLDTRAQRPSASSEDSARRRMSQSSGPAGSPPRETGTDPPQSRAAAPRNLESRPENMQTGYGSPHPQPEPPMSGEPRARDARPTQSMSDTQSRTQVQSTETPVRSRVPPAQSTPSSSVRADDVGLRVNSVQSLPEHPQSSSNQSPKRTVGILKTPSEAPRTPLPDLTDPWGVKIASAEPSRARPKLKAVIGMLRGGDGSKSSHRSNSRVDPTSSSPPNSRQPAPEFVQAPPKSNKSSLQKLRFSETVALIPRPAVDSDPYDDEDDDDDDLPPSPTRESLLWLMEQKRADDESEEDSDSLPEAFSRGPIQINVTGGNRENIYVASAGSLAAYNSEGKGLYLHPPGLHPSGSDSSSSFPDPPSFQWPEATAISQPPGLSASEAFARQRSRSDREGGAHQESAGDRQRKEPQAQSLGTRPGRASFDGVQLESRMQLEVPQDARDRFKSSSNPNLVMEPSQLAPSASLRTRGNPAELRSDHELVRTIFPSPRSTVSERDLLFTS